MSTIQNPELVFAVVPRVAAACSLMGSSWIVLEVLRDAQKRKKVYHRIMLGMSSFDIIASMCYFLGRWPLPPDAPLLPGGVGNKHTVRMKFLLLLECTSQLLLVNSRTQYIWFHSTCII